MASVVSLTEAEGYAKERYGEIERAIPSFAVLQDLIKFSSAQRVGDSYHWPVQVKRSHGVTFEASSGSSLPTLNDPVSLEFKDAILTPIDLVIQEDIGYANLSRMREKGEAAFGSMLDEVALSLREAAAFYVEANLLYGQYHKGAVQTGTVSTSTTGNFVITEATWAPALWAQMEGAYIDLFESDGTTAESVSAGRVTSVDVDTRTVYYSCAANAWDALTAGDVVKFRGEYSSGHKVPQGLYSVASGSSYAGLTYSSYRQFQPNTKAFAGRASMGKIHQLVNKAAVRGLSGDVTVLVSNFSWVDMMNDLAGLRQYSSDTRKEMQLGTNKLVFHGVNGGQMSIVPHPMLMASHILAFQPEKLRRIGSTDTTFRLPGGNENFFMDLEGKAACRLRCYADQTLLCTSPRTIALGTGITPDAT